MNAALQTVSTEAARTVLAHYIEKCRATGANDEQIEAAMMTNWSQIQADIAELSCAAWNTLNNA